jgi:hypothetical protein
MKLSSVSILPPLLSSFHLATCQQQILSPDLRLRNATLDDVADIASVMIAAFSSHPDWQYLYQFRNDFPEEHHRCVQFGVTQALTSSQQHFYAEVIEAPPDSNLTVAAAAIWEKHSLSDEETSAPRVTSKDKFSTAWDVF